MSEGGRPMVRRNSRVILGQINSLLRVGTFSGLSDSQLLERFLTGHDEVSELAFSVLIERHGPMVLGVCRRILVDPHDAEDAFQATFLVLVRKAASVRVDGSIGRWLFGVATRVATRSRADIHRRHGRERLGFDQLEIVAEEGSLSPLDRAELQSILAQEIARLPDRLQAPVILCDLEGSSDLEAARRLGWPVGTVKSRLSRARARLRDRLTRRGLAPSDFAITIPTLPMGLSQSLVEATTRAAQSLTGGRLTTAGIVSASVATLTQGVLRTMYWTKLKLAAVAMLLILTGSAALVAQATAQKLNSGRGIVDHTSVAAKAAEPARPATQRSMSRCSIAPGPPRYLGAMLRLLTGFSPKTSRVLTQWESSSSRNPTCPTFATVLSPTNRANSMKSKPASSTRLWWPPAGSRFKPFQYRSL